LIRERASANRRRRGYDRHMPANLPLIIVLGVYGVMSVVAFIAYAWDKRAAIRGRRRIPELRLHAIELLGGWPGALIGQLALRHKHRKLKFMAIFWMIVVLHIVVWMLWLRFGYGLTGGADG
jgi:uncharacterized membrane protein YsdA (DUF1294 family)